MISLYRDNKTKPEYPLKMNTNWIQKKTEANKGKPQILIKENHFPHEEKDEEEVCPSSSSYFFCSTGQVVTFISYL